MSFSSDINQFIVNVDIANEKVIKAVTISLFGDIIRSSPVDRGRFRANWFLSDATPSVRVTNSVDKSGAKAITNMQNGVTQASDFSTFTLTNNLPYSEVIEFGGYPNPVKRGSKVSKKGESPARYEILSVNGFSRQAPQGVVRVNTVRFESILEKTANKLGYGRI